MLVRSRRHDPVALSPCKNFGAYWIGGWVGLRVGLESFEKEKMSWLYRKSQRP